LLVTPLIADRTGLVGTIPVTNTQGVNGNSESRAIGMKLLWRSKGVRNDKERGRREMDGAE
jgi:hypothetical protein